MDNHYLRRLFKVFLNFFSISGRNIKKVDQEVPTTISQEIDQRIDQDELLVRGVLRPLMFSSKKLQINAVLPQPGQRDVSLVRHRYNDDQFCKDHSKSLRVGDSSYHGLAVIIERKVAEVNISQPFVEVGVISSPLNEDNEIRTDWPIYVNDPGFPAHGSIMYDAPPRLAGVPNPPYVVFAKILLKKMQYFPDPDPEGNEWVGGELTYNKE